MKVTLTHPVEHDGKVYRRVSVRIPADLSSMEDSCPAGVHAAFHNIAVLTGLPLDVALKLPQSDVIAVGREFQRQVEALRSHVTTTPISPDAWL